MCKKARVYKPLKREEMEVHSVFGALAFLVCRFRYIIRFFSFPFLFFGAFRRRGQTANRIMKILQPIKIKSTGRVIGYAYRMRDDGTLQYVSFGSSVMSIEADKVEAASPAEAEATKQRQREEGTRG
jgi:hypothetical protein